MKVKGWAVVWKKEVAKEECLYGKDTIVLADDRCTGVTVDFPIFERKADAEEFRANNSDWKTVPVTISV